MSTYLGKYFDGKSSKHKDVALSFSEDGSILIAKFEDHSSQVFDVKDLITKTYGSHISISFKNAELKSITVKSKEFGKIINKSTKFINSRGFYNWLIGLGKLQHIGLVIISIFLIFSIYKWLIPLVGEKVVVLIPETIDHKIGDNFFETFVNQEDIDSVKSYNLNQFAKELKIEKINSANFIVVKSDEINAFVLPNGQTVVYSGMLKEIDSYSILSALLSHEMAHYRLRHSMKNIGKTYAATFITSVVFGNLNSVSESVISTAEDLTLLMYGREFEEEADIEAIYSLIDNHINPNSMVELLELLPTYEIGIMEYLSTHPSNENRVDYVKKEIAKHDYTINDNDELKRLFSILKND